MQIFSQRNLTSTQKKYLFPVVTRKFQEHQEVVAGGDGRRDRPGNSAKYGTYSIVDMNSSKVLDFSLVQVTEVKNSYAMELEGVKRCFDHLQEERVVISKLATRSGSRARLALSQVCAKEINQKSSNKAMCRAKAMHSDHYYSPLVVR